MIMLRCPKAQEDAPSRAVAVQHQEVAEKTQDLKSQRPPRRSTRCDGLA